MNIYKNFPFKTFLTPIAIETFNQFKKSSSSIQREVTSRLITVAIATFSALDTLFHSLLAASCLVGSAIKKTVGWIAVPKFGTVKEFLPEKLNWPHFKTELLKVLKLLKIFLFLPLKALVTRSNLTLPKEISL